MKWRQSSQDQAIRNVTERSHKGVERTKEIMKKSEMQEINHNKGIMETKKARLSRKENPTQLMAVCGLIGWELKMSIWLVSIETKNDLLPPVSIQTGDGSDSNVSETPNKKKNWEQQSIHPKEKAFINKLILQNVM